MLEKGCVYGLYTTHMQIGAFMESPSLPSLQHVRHRQSLEGTRMTGQEFGKLEAAQRQINAAIRIFIHGEDPIAFHTLASASWKDLRDLSRYLPIPATDSGSSNNKAQH